jgi:pSer/pThr/pTyr-binding forkhead associated (FHA) protein
MSDYLFIHVLTQQPIARFSLPQTNGAIIGRTDINSDFVPDIDLAPFEAREAGVSRRHAALIRYHDALHLIDLSSANGTFLNSRRLRSDVPYRIISGDQIQLGTLLLVLSSGG